MGRPYTGTKHIDPDTGLIYFKYDFGYEFGILFPGEGKRCMATSQGGNRPISRPRMGDIEVPVLHEVTAGAAKDHRTSLDSTKRYSLPIQIDLDHMHDPNYQKSLPGRGRLDVVCMCVCFCLVNNCD